MNGPQHYRKAEELLEQAENPPHYVMSISPTPEDVDRWRELYNQAGSVTPTDMGVIDVTNLLRAAKVHAMLAAIPRTVIRGD